MGIRSLPITKSTSKEMLPIVDIPSIELVIKEAIASGIKEIILVTNETKEDLLKYFKGNKEYEKYLIENDKSKYLRILHHGEELCKIRFVYQKKQLGLGHAIKKARRFVHREPFAVLLPDNIGTKQTPITKQLIQQYKEHRCSIIGVKQVEKQDVSKYGIISYDKVDNGAYHVDKIVEKPTAKAAPSNLACLGRYVFTHHVFTCTYRIPNEKTGEIELTDSIQRLADWFGVYAYEFKGDIFDTGDKLGYAKAFIYHSLNRKDIGEALKKFVKEIL